MLEVFSPDQANQFYCDKLHTYEIEYSMTLINLNSDENFLKWVKYPEDEKSVNMVNINHLYAFRLSLQKLKLFHWVWPADKIVDSLEVMLN